MIWVSAFACAVLIAAEHRGHARLRIAAKLVASAAFVAIGAPALGASPFHTWIVIGLGFGALGDAALLGHSSKMFLAGLGAFLIGHVAYVVACAQLEPPASWVVHAGWVGITAIVGGAIVLAWLWPRLGGMKLPVVLYVIAIVMMVLGAFSVRGTGGLPAPERDYLAFGAALFFLSDLAVARERFVVRDFKNKLFGLPAYYAGQLLIASAIS